VGIARSHHPRRLCTSVPPSRSLVHWRAMVTLHSYLQKAVLPARGTRHTPKWQELCHCIRLLLALHAFVLVTASWLVWWSGVTVFTAALLFSTSVCTICTTTETLLFVANYVPIVLYKYQQKICFRLAFCVLRRLPYHWSCLHLGDVGLHVKLVFIVCTLWWSKI